MSLKKKIKLNILRNKLDRLDIKLNGVNKKAILLELLGNSLGYLTYEENGKKLYSHATR